MSRHAWYRLWIRILWIHILSLAIVLALGSVPEAQGQALYQGFGATTPGGTGMTVVHVTNRNNSGPGSLREAVSQGNRIVVFDVAGDIVLSDHIYVSGAFITIDGFTAPSPGITLRNRGLSIRANRGAHDVIVRGIRVRDSSADGIQVAYGGYNVVIDHVSVSGSGDGNIDITESSHDVTVSWSIIAGTAKNSLIKYNPSRVTLHHNVFTDGNTRNPQVRIDDAGGVATDTTADLRNNVIANWGNGYGTIVWYGPRVNVVNNYYAQSHEALTVTSARAFVQGNVAADGVDVNGPGNEAAPFSAPIVTIESACAAATLALAGAGVRPLDAVDQQFLSRIATPSCGGSSLLVVSPGELGFDASAGGYAPQTAALAITNGGSGSLSWSAATATTSGGAWLSVFPASGVGPATLTVEADPNGLAEGVYQGTVTVTAPGAGSSPRSIPVTLVVDPPDSVATVQVRVSVGTDDGTEDGAGGVRTDTATLLTGRFYSPAFRFRNVPVPAGATIQSAVLELYAWANATQSISMRYTGEAVGNSAPLSPTRWNFSQRLRTDAFVDHTPGPWKLSQHNPSPDLSAIVQEIVDHPDWAPGSSLTLFMADHGSTQARYVGGSENPARAAVLTITYVP